MNGMDFHNMLQRANSKMDEAAPGMYSKAIGDALDLDEVTVTLRLPRCITRTSEVFGGKAPTLVDLIEEACINKLFQDKELFASFVMAYTLYKKTGKPLM